MRRPAVLCLLLTVALCRSGVATNGLDQYLAAEMKLNGIPGVAVAIVSDSRLSLVRGFGVRNTTDGRPMSGKTLIDLASVSKSLTALATLVAARSGRLDLNSPVGSALLGLNRAQWSSVTVRDLLRHRSGLRRRHDYLVPCCGRPGDRDLEVAVHRLASAADDLESQDAFVYANSNFVLLAAIVERASGSPFQTFMQDRVFRPLDLRRTTLDANRAQGWGASAPHEWQWGRVAASRPTFRGWLGSSLVQSTAEDMGTFMAVLLDPTSHEEAFPALRRDWWLGLEPGYDLGWHVHAQADWLDGELVLEHSGNIWGSNTAIVLAPRLQSGVGVLTNLDAGRAGPMARAILRNLGGKPLPEAEAAGWRDRPDAWAIAFLAIAGGLLLAVAALAARVARQLRRGHRAWDPTGLRAARSICLAGLGVWLLHRHFLDPAAPPETLPTTVRQALPALVAGTAALLVSTAAVGLAPKIPGSRNR